MNKNVAQKRANDSRGVRPGFIVLMIAALAISVAVICFFQIKRPAKADAGQATVTEVNTPEVITPESSKPASKSLAWSKRKQLPVAAEPTDVRQASAPVHSTVPQDPQDVEYQRKVSEVVGRVYSGIMPAPAGNDSALPGAPSPEPSATRPQVPGSGLRNYVVTEANRRALVQELGQLRREAIAQANRQSSTNSQ